MGNLLLFLSTYEEWPMMSIFTRHFPTLTRTAMVILNQMSSEIPWWKMVQMIVQMLQMTSSKRWIQIRWRANIFVNNHFFDPVNSVDWKFWHDTLQWTQDGKISYDEFVAMMKTGTDWRKASRHYSRGRFNSLSMKLMKDGSLNLGNEWDRNTRYYFLIIWWKESLGLSLSMLGVLSFVIILWGAIFDYVGLCCLGN